LFSAYSSSSRPWVGSVPYLGRFTGSLSLRTPRSCSKNALSLYSGCGEAVARIHSLEAVSATDHAS
jgi:hypothetical protein